MAWVPTASVEQYGGGVGIKDLNGLGFTLPPAAARGRFYGAGLDVNRL